MKEVKSPKKPLLYYYGIVLLIIIVFNVLVTPMLTKTMVKEVDYGTFMSKIEDKKIDDVQIEDNQILFTEKDSKNTVYKTGLMEDATLTERLYESGAKFSKEIDAQIQRSLDDGFAVLFVPRPFVYSAFGIAKAHAAEAQRRDIQTCLPSFMYSLVWGRREAPSFGVGDYRVNGFIKSD